MRFAAAVLGGTGLSGGYGTILGTLIGALTIGVINNGMNPLSVPYFHQLIVKAMEMRAAANFLVANYGRQKIITMPRSIPKIAIFEEAARRTEFTSKIVRAILSW